MNIKPYQSSREADRKTLKELKESERERKREKKRERERKREKGVTGMTIIIYLNLFWNRDGLVDLKKSGRKGWELGMGFLVMEKIK